MTRRMLQTVGLLVFLAVIVGLVTALSRPGVQPHRASALNSPLPPPAETPDASPLIPVPRAYFPTPVPADYIGTIQPEWVTYEIPGEGLTFRARRDWSVASSRPPTIKYSSISVVFNGARGSISFRQLENRERLSLEAFAKTPPTAGSSTHDQRWLSADVRQYARDISNDHYTRLLIIRDDSDQNATTSINGAAKYTVLVAYDQRALIARSEEWMSPEAEQYFWKVLDSMTFSPIQ